MSGNPFDSDEDQSSASGEILEGFLCPICRADLKSIDVLTDHFARQHAEEEAALKSFKDIFTKAKKKILNPFRENFQAGNFLLLSALDIHREELSSRAAMLSKMRGRMIVIPAYI